MTNEDLAREVAEGIYSALKEGNGDWNEYVPSYVCRDIEERVLSAINCAIEAKDKEIERLKRLMSYETRAGAQWLALALEESAQAIEAKERAIETQAKELARLGARITWLESREAHQVCEKHAAQAIAAKDREIARLSLDLTGRQALIETLQRETCPRHTGEVADLKAALSTAVKALVNTALRAEEAKVKAIEAAREEEIQACAQIVNGSLAADCSCREMQYPHCESYGCSSLEAIERRIRARSKVQR